MQKEMLQKRRQAQLKTKRLRSTLIIGGVVLLVGSFIGLISWNYFKPLAGEEVPHLEDATAHVSEGSDPGPYSSSPPTSGRHYGVPLSSGFYDEDDPKVQLPYPEGYLLHNLEHGYIIFWYNCAVLDQSSCTELKTQISTLIGDLKEIKVIGFPWKDMDTSLAISSWGQIQIFDAFDETAARAFVRTNRNQAPEPNTP